MAYEPEVVVWETTYKCNAKCIHCGSDCASVEKPKELTTAQCFDIIQDLEKIGAKLVILSGGEPLLRKDIGALAGALHRANIKVGIISNCLALNEETIKLVKAMNLVAYGMSVDGATDYMHDYIRGHKGTFKAVMNAFKLLHENDIIPSVVTTVHKLNFHQLPAIRDLLIKNGVRLWQIQYADFIGRMPREAMLTEGQFFEMSKFILDTKVNYAEYFDEVSGADVMGYMSDYSTKYLQGPWYGCHAGMNALGLGSDGSVRGCLSLQRDEYIEGYTTERSLKEIWDDPKSFPYNRQFDISMLTGYCHDCIYAAICKGGCIRSATSKCNERCNPYCLYKIEKDGFTSEEQAKIYFSKEEIAKLYEPIAPLPKEFWEAPLPKSIMGDEDDEVADNNEITKNKTRKRVSKQTKSTSKNKGVKKNGKKN